MKINILKKETREKGMTLTILAEKININRSNISRWIKGDFSPSPESYKKLRNMGYSKECCLKPSKEVEI